MIRRFSHVTCIPGLLGGKPTFRGLRIPVHVVLDLLAAGEKEDNILEQYPDLTKEDIHEALEYSAWLAREESFPLSA